MQDRIQRQHRDAGVTIVSPMNAYIQAGCTIGPDTVIAPFIFIGCDSTVGRDCVLGPFANIPDADRSRWNDRRRRCWDVFEKCE